MGFCPSFFIGEASLTGKPGNRYAILQAKGELCMRMFFREGGITMAAQLIFGDNEDFNPENYRRYQQLEVVVQPDGRYSVWGDYAEDADLLRDTKRDHKGVIEQLEVFADDIDLELEESEEETETN